MTINQIIYRNLKKNLKHYYLYIFALVFSVGLYFAFVTLQYDPALDQTTGTIKGAAGLKASSVLLVGIVSVFLLYANNLFIKRRSKEIGLFQLIGLTKGAIFRILSVENLILYFGSMLVGIFLGFSVSRFIMLILFKLTRVEAVATLRFSPEALVQTVIVFSAIYGLIMLMNGLFIKRQSILSLFHVQSTAQQRVKKMTPFQAVIGLFGIGLILFGYYLSSKLFSSEFLGNQLAVAMLTILASVILGSYLFYKGSVSFIFNMIRKQKGGYLNVNDVLSLSSIMFRMKSNSFLLTVITTLSALAIGLLSLSYISYYSAEKTAEDNIPHHFAIPNSEDAQLFTDALAEADIEYTMTHVDLLESKAYLSNILSVPEFDGDIQVKFSPDDVKIMVLSEDEIEGLDLMYSEMVFVNRVEMLEKIISFKDSGQVTLYGEKSSLNLTYNGFKDITAISTRLTGAFPVAVVDQKVYEELALDKDPEIEQQFTEYVGINIKDGKNVKAADEVFHELDLNQRAGYESRYAEGMYQKQLHGLTMFIVGFLGLAFLITSGCILYFKQMDESEDEKPSYTILRKLGFTQPDLIKGIRIKQLFNFGIPLILGLSHSYFAVKSGWFFFGSEMVTPMVIVMLIYTGLYSVFGVLSVLYYKRVIKDAL
ncbi:ABC transporter permease [Lentibacillus saliphilus]|uniref:ABC transporter permease n=1 Tax=Lentibacillus saliphilus TaxID=2737028 RepID=UPI001C30759A|nr:ABC transporter permease [Lentibacillus saliphilus]